MWRHSSARAGLLGRSSPGSGLLLHARTQKEGPRRAPIATWGRGAYGQRLPKRESEDALSLHTQVDLAEGGAYAIFPELKDAMGLIQKEVAERLLAMMAEAQVSQPHR